jgi:hypothetical protein
MKNEQFIPDWFDAPPAPGSYRLIVKEGRPEQVRVPPDKYFLQLKKDLELEEDDFKVRLDGNQPVGPVPASNIDGRTLQDLTVIVGGENIQVDDYNRLK